MASLPTSSGVLIGTLRPEKNWPKKTSASLPEKAAEPTGRTTNTTAATKNLDASYGSTARLGESRPRGFSRLSPSITSAATETRTSKTSHCLKRPSATTRSALLTTSSVRHCTSQRRAARPWKFLMISSLQASRSTLLPNVRISWNSPTALDCARHVPRPSSTDSTANAPRLRHSWTAHFCQPRVNHATAPCSPTV